MENRRLRYLLCTLIGTLALASIACAEPTIKSLADAGLKLQIGPPLLVAQSPPGEMRWGFFQFPKLSPLPEGGILLTINNSNDDNVDYGNGVASPAFVSRNGGKTWRPYQTNAPAIVSSHAPISPVGDGEYLCLPFAKSLNVSEIAGMPPPAGKFFVYAPRNYYRLSECPAEVRDFYSDVTAYRWTPAKKRWQKERVEFPPDDALIWTSVQSPGEILSRTSIEQPLLVSKGEVFFADYRSRYLRADGSVPSGMVITCMVSRDGGRTFERRGTIADGVAGSEQPGEAMLIELRDGTLLAVGRATVEVTRPMWLSTSRDRGKTWSARENLFDHGVLPTVSSLEKDLLVLSFGRPGVTLSLSPDGGKTWTKGIDIPPIVGGGALDSCGYTAHYRLNDRTVLLAYSDFATRTPQGQQAKGIVVRRITVGRASQPR